MEIAKFFQNVCNQLPDYMASFPDCNFAVSSFPWYLSKGGYSSVPV
jgi:hypothetical protein